MCGINSCTFSSLRRREEYVKVTEMKYVRYLFALFVCLVTLNPLLASQGSYKDQVVLIQVGEDSLSSKQSFGFMTRVLKKAQEEQAKAIVFEMNTPGGLAWETSEMMMKTLQPLNIPTYAFVNTKAMSAGALISAACDKIYMAPVSSIGAAGIINGTGEEMEPMMRKKAESAFWSFTRSVVTEKGHRPEVIQAMMIPSEHEKKFGSVTLEKGELLTLTGKEAVMIMPDGKPLLAHGTAKDVKDLLAQEKIDPKHIIEAKPTGFEKIGLWIAWASPLLILLGVGGIYLEMKTPGFGIGGIVAIAAFGLFFFGNNVAGNLAGYETVGLLILGIVLLCIEFFVIPGTFVAGLGGALCIVAALFGGMISTWEWEHIFKDGNWKNYDQLCSVIGPPLFKLALGLVGSCVLIILMMKYLPDTALMRGISNEQTSGGAAGEAVKMVKVQCGDTGTTLTDLRPNGKALINGEICEVYSGQGLLGKGVRVRVEAVRPFDYVVALDENIPTK